MLLKRQKPGSKISSRFGCLLSQSGGFFLSIYRYIPKSLLVKEDSLIIIRLLESKFPDYSAVIPQQAKHLISIKRDTVLDGMKKMVILSNETYRGVKITLENNNMELMSVNPDLGDVQENLEVEYSNERLEMGFNSRYFIDVLQAMESDMVELGFIDNSSPCLITGNEDKGFLGLVMPMRL